MRTLWQVTFFTSYEIEASTKWEAIEKAQEILDSQKAGDIDYDVDVEILHDENEEE